MIGWLWEVLLFLFTRGEFINRGTSMDKWLPIYGVGSTVVLIVLKIQKQTVADIPFVNGAVRCNRVFYIAYT